MPTNRRIVKTSGVDFYPTPSWATKALLDKESFNGDIWEPCTGTGAMSSVIEGYGYNVIKSDIIQTEQVQFTEDFLLTERRCSNIITNPPYNIINEFVEKAYAATDEKLCLLLRLAFLEGAKRKNTIFTNSPPSKVIVFPERITFYPNGIQTAGSGTTAYGWFIWDKTTPYSETKLEWFDTGYKE